MLGIYMCVCVWIVINIGGDEVNNDDICACNMVRLIVLRVFCACVVVLCVCTYNIQYREKKRVRNFINFCVFVNNLTRVK